MTRIETRDNNIYYKKYNTKYNKKTSNELDLPCILPVAMIVYPGRIIRGMQK